MIWWKPCNLLTVMVKSMIRCSQRNMLGQLIVLLVRKELLIWMAFALKMLTGTDYLSENQLNVLLGMVKALVSSLPQQVWWSVIQRIWEIQAISMLVAQFRGVPKKFILEKTVKLHKKLKRHLWVQQKREQTSSKELTWPKKRLNLQQCIGMETPWRKIRLSKDRCTSMLSYHMWKTSGRTQTMTSEKLSMRKR